MTNEYIYFTSSLPALSFAGEPPTSVEYFLIDCQSQLSGGDYDLVRHILAGNYDIVGDCCETVRELLEFTQGFQNDLAHYRAERAHKDPSNYTRGARTGNQRYMEIITQAGKMANLLEAEQLIDRMKWENWESIAANSFFQVENVIVYGLQLQMLEKYQAIRSFKGTEIFKEITDPAFIEQYLYKTNKE